MVKILIVAAFCVVAFTTGQRITTIHLDGVQYFISRMNPYSPELNYFLAYQYCRSLGLQLASFETKEKAESMTTYLKNAGYGNYDFWTSGNRLGTGMFLWMSTGLPFNATFDFFENSSDAIQAGVLDPVDHNSNTSPQRTARDRRRITSTSASPTEAIGFFFSTTPMPVLISSYAPYMNKDQYDGKSHSSFIAITSDHEEPIEVTEDPHEYNLDNGNYDKLNVKITEFKIAHQEVKGDEDQYDQNLKSYGKFKDTDEESIKRFHDHLKDIKRNEDHRNSEKLDVLKTDNSVINNNTVKTTDLHPGIIDITNTTASDTLSVEKHLGKIFQKLEKVANVNREEPSIFKYQSNIDNITRKSFLSLTDLIRTLRPNDKHIIPQIDSDYSNAMRVLGEPSSIVNIDDLRKF